METGSLKKFAQSARRHLMEQVETKLDQALTADNIEVREKANAIKELKKQIARTSRPAVVERVAYTWFNRFCALRFMDVNRYTTIGVTTPAQGLTQPEILQEAKQGHIDSRLDRFLDRQKIFDYLDGRTPSSDPQQEAYRLLLVAECNYWHSVMPFLFERIADYTELLMPCDLLSENSILASVQKALTAESCKDVEVIGWLYQFYISDKKDEVFASLKKGKKIAPENIPAATQLFTPHWIVRYLVENSLGRLWMLNRPDSRLKQSMDYYIEPEQPETGFLKISSPEELKICDPACGSGHMLVYAFDLLYAIYEEEGYDPPNIPRLILENNLYGIEIDERAGALAAFALVMKAREKYRRFFSKPVQPRICVLENIVFGDNELKAYMDEIGRDLFTINLQETLHQFREADNFGSLIRPALTDMAHIKRVLKQKDVGGDIFLHHTHKKVLKALNQTDFLCPKYHVVVANPPYMGGKGMNGRLSAWAKDNYPNSKFDLFSMFIERIVAMIRRGGYAGVMTPFTWMFLTSFEKLRSYIINRCTITGIVRPEYHSFFESAYVPICGFTIFTRNVPNLKGYFIDLNKFYGADIQPIKLLEAIQNHDCGWFYRASSNDFLKIPGNPIAYWISEKAINLFAESRPLAEVANARQGLITGDNESFLRYWSELGISNIGFEIQSRGDAKNSGKRWFPHHKGGAFRKWYGNHEYVVDWGNDGEKIRNFFDTNGKLRSRPQNLDYYFKPAVTWTSLTVASFNGRLSHGGFIYDAKGPMVAPFDLKYLICLTGLLNCSVTNYLLKLLAPTMDYNQGPVSKLPWPENIDQRINSINSTVNSLVQLAKIDWDSYEISWDYKSLPLPHFDHHQPTLKTTYNQLREHWLEITLNMQRLEEENNRIFLEAYGLQDELKPEVPLNEITLTCNPHYRYGGKKSNEELEELLLTDTMREFISYAVGCMFGRYALDKPGLILANQGETIEDYLKQIPEPTFPADDDNVIPILDGNWFTDDITERFQKFLRVTFGEEHYEENLSFIENAIGKDIRKFFLKDFYADHLKRYKKRPIYWMFSSPKGSFNALIYMHRYRPDTVSVILNDYLREFKTKLSARKEHMEQISISASAIQSEKTNALKEIEKLKKLLDELETWEHDVLYPLASRRIKIDLDDGVKVNYNKFGPALKKVAGLSMDH